MYELLAVAAVACIGLAFSLLALKCLVSVSNRVKFLEDLLRLPEVTEEPVENVVVSDE